MAKEKYLNEVKKIVSYIEENIRENISVQSICQQSTFSRWEFQRIFRGMIGDSIGGYLRGRRLTSSLKDLENPRLKIIDIAVKYQFSSQEAFSRSFKKFFGHTPGYVREHRPKVASKIKPKLSTEKIEKIASHISRNPIIKTISEKKIVGMKKLIDSTLGSDKVVFDTVCSLWVDFMKRRPRVDRIVPGTHYGVITSEDGDMNHDKLEYIAGVEVADFDDVSDEMVKLTVPEQTYAMFEVTGAADSCHIVADYVYGIWLPQSKYKRAEGVDVEIFDNNLYRYFQKSYKSFYCLPVVEA